MAVLRDSCWKGRGDSARAVNMNSVDGVARSPIDDLGGDFKTAKLKARLLHRNGTAAHCADCSRLGVEVVDSHKPLDYTFPALQPRTRSDESLHEFARPMKLGADFSAWVWTATVTAVCRDDGGRKIFSDKMGFILAPRPIPRSIQSTLVAM